MVLVLGLELGLGDFVLALAIVSNDEKYNECKDSECCKPADHAANDGTYLSTTRQLGIAIGRSISLW